MCAVENEGHCITIGTKKNVPENEKNTVEK
jgi:hypothetical protein